MEQLVQGWAEERKARQAASDGAVSVEVDKATDAVADGDESSGVDVAEESVDETPVRQRTTRSKGKAKGKK